MLPYGEFYSQCLTGSDHRRTYGMPGFVNYTGRCHHRWFLDQHHNICCNCRQYLGYCQRNYSWCYQYQLYINYRLPADENNNSKPTTCGNRRTIVCMSGTGYYTDRCYYRRNMEYTINNGISSFDNRFCQRPFSRNGTDQLYLRYRLCHYQNDHY